MKFASEVPNWDLSPNPGCCFLCCNPFSRARSMLQYQQKSYLLYDKTKREQEPQWRRKISGCSWQPSWIQDPEPTRTQGGAFLISSNDDCDLGGYSGDIDMLFCSFQSTFDWGFGCLPPEVIQCFFWCADRYASVYSQGSTGLLAEYTVKKYRSHRSVSAKDLVDAYNEREDCDSRLKHSFNHDLH